MKDRKENIVMFPFMAQSHIIPFLALAIQLEQKGYSITFVNTPLNVKKLQTTLPQNSSIRLLQIPFNSSDHGLPPDAENTDVLPYNLIFRLLTISPCLEPSLRKLLSDLIHGGLRPLCIIADMFFGWSTSVAHEFGLFHSIFNGSGGFGLACYYSIWANLPHRKTDLMEFFLPDFQEAGKMHITQLSSSLVAADGTDSYSIFNQKNMQAMMNADAFVFNTVEELDTTGLAYFRRKTGRPVCPVGPVLLPVNERARAGNEATISPEKCIEWLDQKLINSVLYISFGTQSTISASQIVQLSKALDLSCKNFIWVVRPPLGFDINAEFKAEEWIPEEFLEQIVQGAKRGLIVSKWAPQVEILSHKSTGAFLSHCGWNSVLESLSNGVPIIGWPMAAEQFYNAKFLVEEVGACVEVARGTSFEVRHEDILEKIELVMGENEKGERIRNQAFEAKKTIRDATRNEEGFKGSSVKAMEKFLNAAFSMKEKAEEAHKHLA